MNDNKRQRVTANDSEWSLRLKFLFCQKSGVCMIILKTKRLFLITPEVNGNIGSRCIQNLSKFIHSLSVDVPLAYLCINDPRELRKRYPQLTTEHCILNAKWHQCSLHSVHMKQSVLYFGFTHFRFTISEFRLMWERLEPST